MLGFPWLCPPAAPGALAARSAGSARTRQQRQDGACAGKSGAEVRAAWRLLGWQSVLDAACLLTSNGIRPQHSKVAPRCSSS